MKWAGCVLAAYGTWMEYANHVDNGHAQGEAITRAAGSFTAAKIGSVGATKFLTTLVVKANRIGITAVGLAIGSTAVT